MARRSSWRGTKAPLPEAEVARSYAPFAEARMLPPDAYTDDDVHEWEQANIFSGWVCVGRADHLDRVGAQKSVDTGAGGVLLVRGEDEQIRAFANFCRHRAHQLIPCGGTAQRRSIVCPYHAWSFRLDGSLRNAPGFRDVEGFDKNEFGLVSLPVVDWHGWLFVDPSRSAGEFTDHVGDLESIVAPYRPDELRTVATHSYEIAANWKVIVENYQECYHCPSIHPELCRVSPPESGENVDSDGEWMGGWMDLESDAQTMSLDGRSGGVNIEGLDELQSRTVMYVVCFPNILISLHPDYIMTHTLRPLSASSTHVECSWSFPVAAVEKDGFDPAYAVDFWDLTNRQDWTACESVQLGISSQSALPGPMAPEEDGVHQFVRRIARAYAGLGRDDADRPSVVTADAVAPSPASPAAVSAPGAKETTDSL
ncbi:MULTISPECIES: aromatic ring-hydroxylating oxygenase subunit alpha [unclassified Gordonia (in: high G+C Gram-positive bacteria)]